MSIDSTASLPLLLGGPRAERLVDDGRLLAPPPEATPPYESPYESTAFVARYAAVWAWGLADPALTSEPYYRHLLEVALPDSAPRPATILDAGCGPGRVLAELARRAPRAQGTGVDASAVMVDLAGRLLRGHADVALDAGDFGFAPVRLPAQGRPDLVLRHQTLAEHAAEGHRYDLVVASHLLDRVPSPRQALAELAGMLRPAGRLVVSCAFNYDRRESWVLASGEHLAQAATGLGLRVDSLDEDVPYRERLDIRGTVTEHRVAVLHATRVSC